MITRDQLADSHPDALLLEPEYFDRAIIGVAEQAGGFYVVCYDSLRCISLIAENGGMTHEEAMEWFDVNTSAAYVGEHTPMFITTDAMG